MRQHQIFDFVLYVVYMFIYKRYSMYFCLCHVRANQACVLFFRNYMSFGLLSFVSKF